MDLQATTGEPSWIYARPTTREPTWIYKPPRVNPHGFTTPTPRENPNGFTRICNTTGEPLAMREHHRSHPWVYIGSSSNNTHATEPVLRADHTSTSFTERATERLYATDHTSTSFTDRYTTGDPLMGLQATTGEPTWICHHGRTHVDFWPTTGEPTWI